MSWMLGISVALLGYTYLGYPALIWALSRVRGRPVKKGPVAGGAAVLIAAHNEAESLPRKLKNLLELAKTEPIREIWIGLDGCTDGTGEEVRKTRDWRLETRDGRLETRDGRREAEDPSLKSGVSSLKSAPHVHVLEFEQRRGKAAVLNELMAKAGQPILAMMDARQRVEAGAISALLENFADPQVGAASGALVYESAEGGAQKGAESYWGYEKFIRSCESRFWAVPGATGALYAIRRELCRPIPENTLVDDVLIPMRAVLEGHRCLFEPSARVFDLPTTNFSHENLRKRRTLAGIWQIFRLEPAIYCVFRNPIWFQWVSHKFLRLLTPFLVFLSVFSLGWMAWEGSGVLRALFWGILAGVLASFLAFWGGKWISSRILGLMGAFWSVNWALLRAAWDAATGRFDARWMRRR
ncbi:MAG: glycosyltransferase family 2 protein [Kiritimatiellia bacterium]